MAMAAAGQPRDLEAPLLDDRGEEVSQADRRVPPHTGTCSVFGGVANLTVTAVGAGMLALPKAFATVGVAFGLGLFVFVCFLTYFSTSIVVKFASKYKKRSYGELIKAEFGSGGAAVLQLAIITHVGGVMIVYLIIIADMLVGSSPDFGGVIPTALARHDNPWFLSRPIVVGVLLCGVVLPMLVPRTLTAVARFSRMSIAMVLFLAATICGLATLALCTGQAAPDIRVLPSVADMGDGSPLGVVTAILTVVSVACLAFTCHFNLIPIQQSLREPGCSAMLAVIRYTIALCAALYATVAVSGYVLFGSQTDGDVLKNLNVSYVSSLVHPALASVLINGVAFCYTFNLLVNFVLKVWAVRENVSELVFKTSSMHLAKFTFYQVTVLLVAIAFALSVVVPSVWVLVSLVGSTACVTFSYIFPGLLVLRKDPSAVRRLCAVGTVVLGGMMAAIATYNQLTGRGGL